MRLWHTDMLHFLPDKQFKGQLRELIAIMHDWRDKGKTNHILINYVMDYKKSDLLAYFILYYGEYSDRYGEQRAKKLLKWLKEFEEFSASERSITCEPFIRHHNNTYYKICMTNLYEKYLCGGLSRDEWETLTLGYRTVWKEEWKI